MYDSAGTLHWSSLYSVSHIYDVESFIGLDGAGNVYVGGASDSILYSPCMLTIQYSQAPTGVKSSANKSPAHFKLVQNYPNPFNPSITIRYSLSTPSLLDLNIYNVLGQELTTLIHTTSLPGEYDVHWDAGAFPSGMYFCRLEAISLSIPGETFTDVMKMGLLK